MVRLRAPEPAPDDESDEEPLSFRALKCFLSRASRIDVDELVAAAGDSRQARRAAFAEAFERYGAEALRNFYNPNHDPDSWRP
jgi:hypothetical protein